MNEQDSKRKKIIRAIRTRLEAIKRNAEGFATNAGAQIHVAFFPQLGPDDPYPCLAIATGTDSLGNQQAKIAITLPIEISVVAHVDIKGGADPLDVVEDGISDVKRAIELEDRTLGGLLPNKLQRGPVTAYEREPGSRLVGSVVTYVAFYTEDWGDPHR